MARRRRSSSTSIGELIVIGFAGLAAIIGAAVKFIKDNAAIFIMILIVLTMVLVIYLIIAGIIKKQRKELFGEILVYLNLINMHDLLKKFDDRVIVKSRQTLDNYDDIKYLKEHENFDKVYDITRKREDIQRVIMSFLKHNEFTGRPQYKYIANKLRGYLPLTDGFKVKITYITAAGNNRGERLIALSKARVFEIAEHPEYLMTKGEYNKLIKQQSKDELESKKRCFYDAVNSIIDFANDSKDSLIVKSREIKLDELIQQLFDRTVNSIQKIKQIDSDEWEMLDKYIANIDTQVRKIVEEDNKISKYYQSEEFARLKETCDSLNISRKDFNEYIEEKAQSISKLFGTRIVRTETQNEDTYNYVRAYKKSITPFTAQVSSGVFGSAENDPIGYIIKYFYPNKSQYEEQIQKLKVLIEELETLKEAKIIIDNYKKDYQQYIQSVPNYVLENDEDGFYLRLGLATIDEAVLNVEYKFTYTSNGGMAQRSFSVPMNEENIIELISQLENKLSLQSLTKEQRALMTVKLRTFIKERDNYTCCMCGNSIHAEPNLLLEVDHIIPIIKGGLTKEDNLQTLCWKCNRSKGAKII